MWQATRIRKNNNNKDLRSTRRRQWACAQTYLFCRRMIFRDHGLSQGHHRAEGFLSGLNFRLEVVMLCLLTHTINIIRRSNLTTGGQKITGNCLIYSYDLTHTLSICAEAASETFSSVIRDLVGEQQINRGSR